MRGKTGLFVGNLNAMISILKGLPLSYFKDLQDDKELIFRSYDQLKNSLAILNDILKNIIINKKKNVITCQNWIYNIDRFDRLYG